MPEQTQYQSEINRVPADIHQFNWWSWRPGIRPRSALLIGLPILLLALLMIGSGGATLIAGQLDSGSAPLRLAGTVVGHTFGIVDRIPRLAIALHTPGFPAIVSSVVSQSAYQSLHNGQAVIVSYSPRLHFLYAIESSGPHSQRFTVPGSSPGGNPAGSLALLLLGLCFLPYPAFLVGWAWHDLRGKPLKLQGQILAIRASAGQRARRSGLTPRLGRSSWYGIALQPPDESPLTRVQTFSVSRETCQRLREGLFVQITYSPALHYVYQVEPLESGDKQ